MLYMIFQYSWELVLKNMYTDVCLLFVCISKFYQAIDVLLKGAKSKGIGQWTINWCTHSMMINHHLCRSKLLVKRLDSASLEPTKSRFNESSQSFKSQQMTLGTNIINGPLSWWSQRSSRVILTDIQKNLLLYHRIWI